MYARRRRDRGFETFNNAARLKGGGFNVWLVGFRDLQWRRKRFFIAVLSTALVFAVTLLLAGISAFFHNEVSRTMRELAVDAWVVPAGTAGPFTTPNLFPASESKLIATIAGVERADPIVLFHQTARMPAPKDLNLIGFVPGGVGQPRVDAGRLPTTRGEIVIDRSFGRHVGQTIVLERRTFRIVGTTKGITYLGGIPAAFMSLADAQSVVLDGSPLASAIVTRGVPAGPLPDGFARLSNASVRADLARPLGVAATTVHFLSILLWLIAAGIIAGILYMSALERTKEFAVIKAMGAGNRFVMVGLGSQAVVLSITAAVVAFAIAHLLSPSFPMSVEIPLRSYIELIVVSLSVGVLGSLAGLRRVLTVDPSVAFGGA